MSAERSPYGHAIAGAGGLALAISVFLPWFAVTTPQSTIDQLLGKVDQSSPLGQFETRAITQGAAYLQAHPVTVTAQNLYSRTWIVLLVIGVLALLLSVAALARSAPLFAGGDQVPLGLLGLAAAGLTAYRLVHPVSWHSLTFVAFDFSRREGGWIALAGAVAVLAGGALSNRTRRSPQAADATTVWADLSGWTPGA